MWEHRGCLPPGQAYKKKNQQQTNKKKHTKTKQKITTKKQATWSFNTEREYIILVMCPPTP